MKRPVFQIMLVAVIMAALNISCDNDIDVIGEWKEIPVVYGVINPLPLFEPMQPHYIRIEKAFLDPTTDAYLIAQNPDSIYYGPNDLQVVLFEETSSGPIVLDTFERVDATTVGFPVRDSGIFASSPNYIYYSDAILPVGRCMHLQVTNLTNDKVYDIYTKAFQPGNRDFTDSTFENFRILTPSISKALKWVYYDDGSSQYVFNDIRVSWSTGDDPVTGANADGNGAVYDLSVTLKYQEYEVDNNGAEVAGTRVAKSITWNPVKNSLANGAPVLTEKCGGGIYNIFVSEENSLNQAKELSGENFFQFLANNLSNVNGTNIRRCAGYIDFRVDCAGPELAEYLRTRNANQNLIGGLFPIEPFTNIPGGHGIFTTKMFTNKRNFNLDEEVLEYLKYGEITQGLGFEEIACF